MPKPDVTGRPFAYGSLFQLPGKRVAEVARDEVERHGVLVRRQQGRLPERRGIGAAPVP